MNRFINCMLAVACLTLSYSGYRINKKVHKLKDNVSILEMRQSWNENLIDYLMEDGQHSYIQESNLRQYPRTTPKRFDSEET